MHYKTWIGTEKKRTGVWYRGCTAGGRRARAVPLTAPFPPNLFVAVVFLLGASTSLPCRSSVVVCMLGDRFKFSVPLSPMSESFPHGVDFFCTPATTLALSLRLSTLLVGHLLQKWVLANLLHLQWNPSTSTCLMPVFAFGCSDTTFPHAVTPQSQHLQQCFLVSACMGVMLIPAMLHAHGPSHCLLPPPASSPHLCACPHLCRDVVFLVCSCQVRRN